MTDVRSFLHRRRRAALVAGLLALGATPALAARADLNPVTSNDTPYSRCLVALAQAPGDNLPVIAVGEVADKTGQFSINDHGYALSQGAAEMLVSALYKTRKARLLERSDLRLLTQELNLRKLGQVVGAPKGEAGRTVDFVITGALTELNYNIVSDGIGLWIKGVGAGRRTAVVNVALDLRVVDARSMEIVYVSSLQKRIVGREIEANVFRFFNSTLIELDAGRIRNEPLQLGVRSVVEMAAHQIMTDYLGLPQTAECRLVESGATALPLPTQGKIR